MNEGLHENPQVSEIELFRELFFATLQENDDVQEFLSNLAVCFTGRKGVAPVYKHGEVIGFTLSGTERLSPSRRREVYDVRDEWLELIQEGKPEDIRPDATDKESLIDFFTFTAPEEITPAELNILRRRALAVGLIESDSGLYRSCDMKHPRIGAYVQTVKNHLDGIKASLKEKFRQEGGDEEGIERIAEMAIEAGFLQRHKSGLIVQASHTDSLGRDVWEAYLKAYRRLQNA